MLHTKHGKVGNETIVFTPARQKIALVHRITPFGLAGIILLALQNEVFEGNNSVSLHGLARLQSGIYILQMANDHELQAVKLIISSQGK